MAAALIQYSKVKFHPILQHITYQKVVESNIVFMAAMQAYKIVWNPETWRETEVDELN